MDRKVKKEILRKLRCGLRLNVKSPKAETPRTVYNRKRENWRRFEKDSSFFINFFQSYYAFKEVSFDIPECVFK